MQKTLDDLIDQEGAVVSAEQYRAELLKEIENER